MNLIEIPKKSKDDCIKSFTNYILKDYNYEILYKLTSIGELGENNLRGIAWKIFMGVLPGNELDKWVENLSYLRTEYKILSDKIQKEQNYFEDAKKEKNIKSSNSIGKLLKKHSSLYNPFHHEKETKELIDLDLKRTFQELSLFHDEKIKKRLSQILFLWNKENSEPGYQQGMNDILSIIFLSLYPYYFPNENKNNIESLVKSNDKNKIINNAEDIYLFFHDEDELNSDLFICFNHVMKKGVKSFYDYEFESHEKQTEYFKKHLLFKNIYNLEKEGELDCPLNLRCKMIINEKLKVIDKELFEHFNKIDLDCTIFLQRWLKCLFNREFELKDVLIIWDAVLATPCFQKGYNLFKIDMIVLSMILRKRNILLLCDQNQCFMLMLQYPRIENILELIIFSDKLQLAVIDLIEGRKSIFIENVKSFIINYNNKNKNINEVKKTKDDNKVNNYKNNDDAKFIKENKTIEPIKNYQEGIERLGNIFNKYRSLMSITDEREFINIIQFFNNYK